MTYFLDETMEQAMATDGPMVVRKFAIAIKDMDTELHEHASSMRGIKDLVLAQSLIFMRQS